MDIKAKATEIHNTLEKEGYEHNFTASNGWLQRFKMRYDLTREAEISQSPPSQTCNDDNDMNAPNSICVHDVDLIKRGRRHDI